MLSSNHPDDERLSALASHDDDATADATLTTHVSTCDRCTDLVTEIGGLRASLADLPDLAPTRPLRLLPLEPEPSSDDRLGGWVRRLFTPALTAGAALALVGLIGTTAPALDQMASGPGGDAETGATLDFLGDGDAAGDEPPTPMEVESDAAAPAAEGDGSEERLTEDNRASGDGALGIEDERSSVLPAERSPWPMVLFTGVALLVGAALLRWILVPRAG